MNPLEKLIGVWEGNKGTDLAPKPDVDENNPYYETLTIVPVDIDVENAGEQHLRAVRYHQLVREIANDKVSHDETGFWIWDKENGTIMCSFSIPRGVSVLAGGEFDESGTGPIVLDVKATLGDQNWGIVQSPFMEKKASTKDFSRKFVVNGDSLSYVQEMTLDIYGKIFNHKDSNSLTRKK